MCKHVAAVLYGIGARLDEKPELLFVLRGVDHTELVTEDAAKAVVGKARKADRRTLDESELSEVFGIDVAPVSSAKARKAATDTKSTGPAKPHSVRSSQGLHQPAGSSARGKRVKTKEAGRKKPRDK